MNFESPQLVDQFKASFGKSIEELTVQEVWWLVKLAKHIRGRCRSNVALRNYLARNFTGHNFREVTVEGNRGPFKALAISPKHSPDIEVKEEAGDEE